MKGWRRVALGDLAESVDYGVTASAIPVPAGPKFLRITDIQDGAVNWEDVPWCECNVSAASNAQLKPGDIVFARTGATTGKSFLIRNCPADAVFASYLIRVRLGAEAEPRYVSYFFQTREYWAQITRSARGVAQPGVNATTLKTLVVSLPSLPEQRRIAEMLDRAEALRAKRRAALAQLDSLTQATFLSMFGEPVINPKGWPESSVGEVAGVQGGLQVTSARKHLPCEVPYLRVANVYRGFLDLREIKTIRATDAEIARTALLKGDLLIVEGHGNPSEIGRCALWDGSVAPCVHQNHLIRARFQNGRVAPQYACEYLNSRGGRRHLLRAGKTTSGLNTISVTEVRGTPLTLPPITLQRKFVRRVDAIEKLRIAHRASLAELDALFASLQHRAFRGEL